MLVASRLFASRVMMGERMMLEEEKLMVWLAARSVAFVKFLCFCLVGHLGEAPTVATAKATQVVYQTLR